MRSRCGFTAAFPSVPRRDPPCLPLRHLAAFASIVYQCVRTSAHIARRGSGGRTPQPATELSHCLLCRRGRKDTRLLSRSAELRGVATSAPMSECTSRVTTIKRPPMSRSQSLLLPPIKLPLQHQLLPQLLLLSLPPPLLRLRLPHPQPQATPPEVANETPTATATATATGLETTQAIANANTSAEATELAASATAATTGAGVADTDPEPNMAIVAPSLAEFFARCQMENNLWHKMASLDHADAFSSLSKLFGEGGVANARPVGSVQTPAERLGDRLSAVVP